MSKEEFEVELELKDELVLELALLAHEENITLNEYVNKILSEALALINDE